MMAQVLRESSLPAELSFGCASYLIKRPEGNILVDVPRYVPKLVNRIKVWCRAYPTFSHLPCNTIAMGA